MATRTLEQEGTLGKKLRVLDDKKTGPEQVLAMRLKWQALCNAHLAQAGLKARITMGRLEEGAQARDPGEPPPPGAVPVRRRPRRPRPRPRTPPRPRKTKPSRSRISKPPMARKRPRSSLTSPVSELTMARCKSSSRT